MKILLLAFFLHPLNHQSLATDNECLFVLGFFQPKLIKRLLFPAITIALAEFLQQKLTKNIEFIKKDLVLLNKDLKTLFINKNHIMAKSFDQQKTITLNKINQVRRSSKLMRLSQIGLKVIKSVIALIIISLISNHITTKDIKTIAQVQADAMEASQGQQLNDLTRKMEAVQNTLLSIDQSIKALERSLGELAQAASIIEQQ